MYFNERAAETNIAEGGDNFHDPMTRSASESLADICRGRYSRFADAAKCARCIEHVTNQLKIFL